MCNPTQDPTPMTTIATLMQKYERKLVRFAARFVGQDTAEDVVQDTFLRAIESGVNFDDERIGAWLYAVCRNRAIDTKRRRDARTVELQDVAGTCDIEDMVAVQQVLGLIAALPPKKAKVLTLRFRDGKSYQQIATEMGMTVTHVGVVLHECTARIRRTA